MFFPHSQWTHVQHRTVEARLTIIVIPPLTPMSEQGCLQKAVAIRACLLGSLHHILCRPSALVRHPNITQTIGGWRTTLLHTLLAPKTGGDTLAWVVDAYDILGIHCLQPSQKVSLHPEANKHLPQHFTWHNIKRLFEVYKATIKWFVLWKFAIWKVGQ